MQNKNNSEIVVFGGGCFWCTEAVFEMLKGIVSVIPGYAGGPVKSPNNDHEASPTYEEICSGKTGHAEVIKVEFDPTKISYKDLLTVFFGTHDPTTMNRQGNDFGTEYRSIILCTTEEQKREAEEFIKEINASNLHGNPVITEVKPLGKFYKAEDYHHGYYKKNTSQPYCQVVINPKLETVQKKFARLLAPGG